MLDRIDYNIEQTHLNVSSAVIDLRKAEKHQKRNKSMLCIYVLIIACVILTLVLIIKTQ